MRGVNDFSYGPSTLLASNHHMVKNLQEKSISPRMSNLEGKHKKGRGKGGHKHAKQINRNLTKQNSDSLKEGN